MRNNLKMRIISILSILIIILYSQEAFVTAFAEYIDLNKVISGSTFIIKAQKIKSKITKNQYDQFKILEILKGRDTLLKINSQIEVHPANEDLFKSIAEDQKKNLPTPFPIIETYRGLTQENFQHSTEIIVFLIKNNEQKLQFYCDGSYESVLKKSHIFDIIKSQEKK
jgi:hypothetical protein